MPPRAKLLNSCWNKVLFASFIFHSYSSHNVHDYNVDVAAYATQHVARDTCCMRCCSSHVSFSRPASDIGHGFMKVKEDVITCNRKSSFVRRS